jgi:N-sulfoglucosamine sulfohydrolase
VNILYIHSHDTGRCIEPYGSAVKTPYLQHFAEQGVLFQNAFCAAPTCSPSRAALLTGQYPHQNGMVGLCHRGARLKYPARHLANFLKSHGYATALSGVQHVADRSDPRNVHRLGYEQVLTAGGWPGAADMEACQEWYAGAARDFLRKADRSRPFFLDCGFFLTHRAGHGGTSEQWHTTRQAPGGDPRYVRPPAILPNTPETRRDFADFRVAVNLLDSAMGQVLDALDSAGLADTTLVIITTDHGMAFPRMKCNLTAHGTGVMLLLRGPGGFRGGKVVDDLASQIDLFPTICEAAGLPLPDWLEGVSLGPSVREGKSVREAVFAEVNWHAAPEPMRSVRTERYSYIRRFAATTAPVWPNCDDSTSKSYLRAAGWGQHRPATETLHDLVFDPTEVANVAMDPAYSAVLEEFRAKLHRWMTETADPLLHGRLDPWPDSTENSVSDDSPQDPCAPAKPILCPSS